ncbi:MAG: biopolymer transporter ExbD [Bdellovibrionales bacterium]|nr:biopolymer transporter ExbD [Bdellovibrionales bacterium]
MAHIEEKSEGRQATVDVNLVPFIDLMSVCIIFLLITAVWTQVSMIQIGSSIYGKKSSDDTVQPPPRAEIPFRLDVKTEGYGIVVGRSMTTIPKLNGEYNKDALLIELKKVKELYPEKVDAVITVLDELPYKTLIDGMDALLTTGFPEIAVSTAGAGDAHL